MEFQFQRKSETNVATAVLGQSDWVVNCRSLHESFLLTTQPCRATPSSTPHGPRLPCGLAAQVLPGAVGERVAVSGVHNPCAASAPTAHQVAILN
uniref:Uncharacterized protein n=1 Tax=Aegilops tauschii TaxID=37682 RepID=R7W8K5_AEGTA